MQFMHINDLSWPSMAILVLSKMPLSAGPSALNVTFLCDTTSYGCHIPHDVMRDKKGHVLLNFGLGYSNLRVDNHGFKVDMLFSGHVMTVGSEWPAIVYSELMKKKFGNIQIPPNIQDISSDLPIKVLENVIYFDFSTPRNSEKVT